MATSAECDVKLEHDDFKCITPVILAKGLAHECLIGMKESDNSSLSKNPEIARLNNICLPRIRADFDFNFGERYYSTTFNH